MNRSPESEPDQDLTDGSVDPGAKVRITFAIVAVAVAAVAVAWTVFQPRKGERYEITGSWLARTATVQEDVGSVELTVVLSAPAHADVVIEFETRGTATANDDYQLATNTVRIPAGQDRAALSVLVVNDGDTDEGRESVRIAIATMTNARVAPPGIFTLVIGETRKEEERPSARDPDVPVPGVGNTPTPTSNSDPHQVDSAFGLVRLADGSMGDSTTASIGRFETSPDSLMLLIVSSATYTGPAAVPSIRGSREWELVETSTRNPDGPRRVSIFRAASGVGGPDTAMIEFDRIQEVVNWIVVEVKDAPIDQNGAAAIVQTGVAAAIDFEFSASVELSPLQSTQSVTVGAFFIGSNRARAAEGFETIALVGPPQRLLLGVVGGSSLLATAEWPTRAHWIGVAVEVTRQR
jgi:hypothetical protein